MALIFCRCFIVSCCHLLSSSCLRATTVPITIVGRNYSIKFKVNIPSMNSTHEFANTQQFLCKQTLQRSVFDVFYYISFWVI
uniref:Secreted protein n=1 Tax=Parascaris univalens TaxID=6257 RepID=A0A915B5J9_PARUN